MAKVLIPFYVNIIW